MGFWDRGYARDDSSLRRGAVVKWLIGLTLVTYLAELILVGGRRFDIIGVFGAVPCRLFEDFWLWQLVTHAFLHDPISIWHLLFNMLFLYWLGTDLAEVNGPRQFLAIYFGGAAACALGHAAVGYASGKTAIPAIGASGAIMSVMVVAAFLFPNRPIWIFGFFQTPLWLAVLLFVGMDVTNVNFGNQPGVASAGHLGGAAFGLGFYWIGIRGGMVTALWSFLGRVLPRGGGGRSGAGEWDPGDRESDPEVDRILDKIKEQGMSSLTARELETLREASRRSDRNLFG